MKKQNPKIQRANAKQQRIEKFKGGNTMNNYKKSNTPPSKGQSATALLHDHCVNTYGQPRTDEESINILSTIFKERMDLVELTPDIKEGIKDYYLIIKHRNLPAFDWLLEAIYITSKKGAEKKNLSYVVGMIRQWLKYGFGHIPNSEEGEVLDFFDEVVGSQASHKAINLIENLLGRYGAIKVTRMIGKLNVEEIDISLIMATMLKDTVEDKYGK